MVYLHSFSFSTVWHRNDSRYIKNHLSSMILGDPLESLDLFGQYLISTQEPHLTKGFYYFVLRVLSYVSKDELSTTFTRSITLHCMYRSFMQSLESEKLER